MNIATQYKVDKMVQYPAFIGKMKVSGVLARETAWMAMFLSEFKVIGYSNDNIDDTVTFIAESKHFDCVNEGEKIPHYSCTYKRNDDEFSYLMAIEHISTPFNSYAVAGESYKA